MSEKRDDPVDLALAADFRLGGLDVSPSIRETRRGDLREVLEPGSCRCWSPFTRPVAP